ncbi:MAG: fumarate hydratase, partial [Thermodesulfovibrionales bacterium]|nr:fumarate hydratase [Thermodesulfovibrionales bacterium]
MLKLRDGIVELYRKVATSLPPDVEDALKAACVSEKKGSNARHALEVILENIRIARETARPICQDTGVPVFYVKTPIGLSQIELEKTIIEATRLATEKVPLRPNAVDIITEKNTGDNTGIGFPVIYFRETPDSTLSIDLMLKGSGCENVGQTYKLPTSLSVESYSVIAREKSLTHNAERHNAITVIADRDLDGVRKCVLDAVHRAQGRGCSPYTIGVGIGAAKDQVARLAKEQLMRRLTDTNNIEVLFKLEKRLLKEINTLGIGPIGFGGKTTALGVKIGVNHRHPASYFVDISVCCWANRRGRL